jgi:hypothetical protein
VWLVLIGDGLIRELAVTLAKAANRPADEMLAHMLAQRSVGWGETPSIPMEGGGRDLQ